MFYTEEESELFRTVLLANHLFGRLAANFGQNYFVSHDHRSHDIYNKCPCDECGEKIPYNNSGIGMYHIITGQMMGGGGHILMSLTMSFDPNDDKNCLILIW